MPISRILNQMVALSVGVIFIFGCKKEDYTPEEETTIYSQIHEEANFRSAVVANDLIYISYYITNGGKSTTYLNGFDQFGNEVFNKMYDKISHISALDYSESTGIVGFEGISSDSGFQRILFFDLQGNMHTSHSRQEMFNSSSYNWGNESAIDEMAISKNGNLLLSGNLEHNELFVLSLDKELNLLAELQFTGRHIYDLKIFNNERIALTYWKADVGQIRLKILNSDLTEVIDREMDVFTAEIYSRKEYPEFYVDLSKMDMNGTELYKMEVDLSHTSFYCGSVTNDSGLILAGDWTQSWGERFTYFVKTNGHNHKKNWERDGIKEFRENIFFIQQLLTGYFIGAVNDPYGTHVERGLHVFTIYSDGKFRKYTI